MTRRARPRALLIVSMAATVLSGCNLGLGSGDAASPATSSAGVGSTTQKAIYSLSGTVSGLSQSGLTLTSGTASVALASGATAFTFSTLLASGASYSVDVGTQPTGQSCQVSHGEGSVAAADVTDVQVTCTLNSYTIGGTVSGLNGTGLVLANGTSTLTVPLGSSAFVFATKVAFGASYAVSVQTSPPGMTCEVVNGMDVMGAGAVGSIQVLCGAWGWMSGASSAGASGTYGTQGHLAPDNVPGARTPAASWIDGSGNLWLFGGQGVDSTGASGALNDLWKYSPGSGWTWVSGGSGINAAGVYGMQGSPDSANVPGARVQAASWIDTNGNLWLFGGQGVDANGASGALNDLWKYNIGSGKWTWISGAETAWPSGSPLPPAEPGARSGAVSWIDASGNLWLFGGTGTQGLLDDLWQFSPGGGWTAVSGAPTAANAFGVYGTLGKAAAGNWPGSRTQAAAAIDTAGNLWLFGGTGYGALGNPGALNDLWEFSPTAPAGSQWTWRSGWNTVGAPGQYGTASTAAQTPGARYAAAAAADAAGNLWLFGGTGADAQGRQGLLSDLWEYDNAASQWIWMGGSQGTASPGVYGTEGTPSAANSPGARSQGVAWVDGGGDFWLFGGQGEDGSATLGLLNDLWEFVP